jgi:hypothetical protein
MTIVSVNFIRILLVMFNLRRSFQVIPMWSKLVEELEPIGFVLATVHSEHERELARKVGVRELPHLLLLTDGKVSSASFLQLRLFSSTVKCA